jgi:hypothetical protein
MSWPIEFQRTRARARSHRSYYKKEEPGCHGVSRECHQSVTKCHESVTKRKQARRPTTRASFRGVVGREQDRFRGAAGASMGGMWNPTAHHHTGAATETPWERVCQGWITRGTRLDSTPIDFGSSYVVDATRPRTPPSPSPSATCTGAWPGPVRSSSVRILAQLAD